MFAQLSFLHPNVGSAAEATQVLVSSTSQLQRCRFTEPVKENYGGLRQESHPEKLQLF